MPGRPSTKPTKAQRDRVMLCVADGWSHQRIAAALGIASGTLERHFNWELELGGDRKRLELLDVAYEAAKKGNVSAIKWLMARMDAAYKAEVAESRTDRQGGEIINFPTGLAQRAM